MKQFKFFKEKIDDSDIVELLRSDRRPRPMVEGWNAHRFNIPPGQCPYDIGTMERTLWMTGWSSRESEEPIPTEDELYMEVTDVDTGENFGVPASLINTISYRARLMFDNRVPESGRCEYDSYEYFIDNVYRSVTTEDRLVIDVGISVPNNGRSTYHRVRHLVQYW